MGEGNVGDIVDGDGVVVKEKGGRGRGGGNSVGGERGVKRKSESKGTDKTSRKQNKY